MSIEFKNVDAIEVATVALNLEAPVEDGCEAVEQIDGESDLDGYQFRAYSVYGRLRSGEVECLADCWDLRVARALAQALAVSLSVPLHDHAIEFTHTMSEA
jgi:hypothetical protein